MIEDAYVAVDEVAERLGLPLGVLVRRVQAGDVPARRIDGPDGPRYELRLSDLGIEPNYVFDSAPAKAPVAVETTDFEINTNFATADYGSDDVHIELTGSATAEQSLTGTSRDSWRTKTDAPDAESWDVPPQFAKDQYVRPSVVPVDDFEPEWPSVASITAEPLVEEEPVRVTVAQATLEPEATTHADEDITAAVPPPVRESRTAPTVSVMNYQLDGPLADINGMSIDPRELVAGLLDRWERTLEQRIYAEQRQRFESELAARQNLVKELQLELKTAHAEKAAARAESARELAEREERIRDRERELNETQAELAKAVRRKRGWFFGR